MKYAKLSMVPLKSSVVRAGSPAICVDSKVCNLAICVDARAVLKICTPSSEQARVVGGIGGPKIDGIAYILADKDTEIASQGNRGGALGRGERAVDKDLAGAIGQALRHDQMPVAVGDRLAGGKTHFGLGHSIDGEVHLSIFESTTYSPLKLFGSRWLT